jgi:hypothetical protein
VTRHANPAAGEVYSVVPAAGPGAADGDLRLVLELAAVHHPPPAHVHPHAFRNSSGAPVRVEVLVVPGAAVRACFDDLFAPTDDGRVDRRGQLALPDAARLLRRHPDALRMAGVPGPVRTGLLAVLARLPGRSGRAA